MRLLLFLLLAPLFMPPGATAQNLLVWDGESIDSTCSFEYGAPDSIEPYAGEWCFAGEPDQWHSPKIILCGDTWRTDISAYDEIRFQAKSDSLNRTFRVKITGWPYEGRSVQIDPYIEGGSLDTAYRLVRIPVDSLKTAEFPLNRIEILHFGTAEPEDGHRVFIDDVWAMDLRPTAVDTVALLSANVLKLTIHDRFDIDYARTPGLYRITSTDDPDFAAGPNPSEVGIHYRVDDFAENTTSPHVVFEIFLVFAQSFENGSAYRLSVENIRDAAGNDFDEPFVQDFIFADAMLINRSVKVNQAGYLPDGPKFGYVGNYLGDAGAMAISPSVFEIRDSTSGVVVFSGTPSFRGDDSVLSGEVVYDCDFSSFSTPGSFYLYLPGIGRSPGFRIADGVFDPVYYASARALYYQRCGTALSTPHADPRWTHDACHPDDGTVHESHAASALYGGETIGGLISMPRGWHDAGDYGKYVATAAVALDYLFAAFELYPEKFPDGFWDIPESGNGVPDVLDEIQWELDWLGKMQAADGGVFHKITTTAYADEMPEDDTATRWISPKSTHSTAVFAAVLAAAYRHFLPYRPDFADSCLARAERAWDFLEAHPEAYPPDGFSNPPGIGGGEYGDPEGDRDDRAWAAAELYKSTGRSEYHDAFELYWPQHPPGWGWNTFQHHQRKASWAYCTTSFPVNGTYVDAYKSDLGAELNNNHILRTDANVYRNAYRSDVLDWIGWGSFAQSTQYSLDLIKGAFLLENESYLTYAKINLDAQLGNNPQCISYITGIGLFSPDDPLQIPSHYDGVDDPVPGLPVFGPAAHIPMSNDYYYRVQSTDNLYPAGESTDDPYPILRRYYDIFELPMMSEFTIQEIALSIAVYSFFSDVEAGATGTGEPESLPFAPARVVLHPNRPNPFNPTTTIRFHLPAECSDVALTIFGASGRRVRTFLGGRTAAGTHSVVWDGLNDEGRQLGSGTYFARLFVSENGRESRSSIIKMTLIR